MVTQNPATPEQPSKLMQWCVSLIQKVSTSMPDSFRNTLITSLDVEQESETAKGDAKNRLKFLLLHDRTELTPASTKRLRDDLVEVISRYVDIDKDALDVSLEEEDGTIALVANIAVRGKRDKKNHATPKASDSEVPEIKTEEATEDDEEAVTTTS